MIGEGAFMHMQLGTPGNIKGINYSSSPFIYFLLLETDENPNMFSSGTPAKIKT